MSNTTERPTPITDGLVGKVGFGPYVQAIVDNSRAIEQHASALAEALEDVTLGACDWDCAHRHCMAMRNYQAFRRERGV